MPPPPLLCPVLAYVPPFLGVIIVVLLLQYVLSFVCRSLEKISRYWILSPILFDEWLLNSPKCGIHSTKICRTHNTYLRCNANAMSGGVLTVEFFANGADVDPKLHT